MTATEYVILVDKEDEEIGFAEKLIAHQKNLLHRAFSIFLFQSAAPFSLLLQQRALNKYHSPGLWTNTCCSHPKPYETILAAGERRLKEELGIHVPLKNVGRFHYNAHFENGLAENEIDHVLIGKVENHVTLTPHPDEIRDLRWVTIADLAQELAVTPHQFTPWLAQAFAIARTAMSEN
jgi:isopentenyl-diphosphate delta-isomerase type 1